MNKTEAIKDVLETLSENLGHVVCSEQAYAMTQVALAQISLIMSNPEPPKNTKEGEVVLTPAEDGAKLLGEAFGQIGVSTGEIGI